MRISPSSVPQTLLLTLPHAARTTARNHAHLLRTTAHALTAEPFVVVGRVKAGCDAVVLEVEQGVISVPRDVGAECGPAIGFGLSCRVSDRILRGVGAPLSEVVAAVGAGLCTRGQ